MKKPIINFPEEKLYPKRKNVYLIRVWDKEDILNEINIGGAHVNKTFIKKILSKALPKLWNGESYLNLTIEVLYKGDSWS